MKSNYSEAGHVQPFGEDDLGFEIVGKFIGRVARQYANSIAGS